MENPLWYVALFLAIEFVLDIIHDLVVDWIQERKKKSG